MRHRKTFIHYFSTDEIPIMVHIVFLCHRLAWDILCFFPLQVLVLAFVLQFVDDKPSKKKKKNRKNILSHHHTIRKPQEKRMFMSDRDPVSIQSATVVWSVANLSEQIAKTTKAHTPDLAVKLH